MPPELAFPEWKAAIFEEHPDAFVSAMYKRGGVINATALVMERKADGTLSEAVQIARYENEELTQKMYADATA